MKKNYLLSMLIIIFGASSIHGKKNFTTPTNRLPSPPFITGDGFRNHCDYAYDETTKKQQFPTHEIKNGNVIFVKTDLINEFFSHIHPRIHARYIIISHNSDASAPGAGKKFLDDEKIIHWLGHNPDCIHEKFTPIPIGIENRYCARMNHTAFKQLIENISPDHEKKHWLYMNFNINTNPTERGLVYNLFKDQSFCVKNPGRVSQQKFLQYLIDSYAVLSPRGNGLDCHRTWETLYLGSIPIVRTSCLDPSLQNLPVIIVQDWHELTFEYLKENITRIQKMNYSYEELTLEYWLTLIDSYRTH